MKRILPVILLSLMTVTSIAQTPPMSGGNDGWGGWFAVVGSGHPHAQTATCSQSGTQATCTVTDGTKFWFNVAAGVGERIWLTGCVNTAMNSVHPAFGTATTYDQGAYHINSGGISGNTITMTSDTSNQTVAATTCTFAPAIPYKQTITGGPGLGPKFFTPDNHYFFSNHMTADTGVNNTNPNLTKYGTTCAGRSAELGQYQTWNFNTAGTVSGIDPSSQGGCPSSIRPFFVTEAHMSLYAGENLNNYASQATVDTSSAVGPNWNGTGCAVRHMIDAFSPYFPLTATGLNINGAGANHATYPGYFGALSDDTGQNEIFGNGPNFHGNNATFPIYNDCSSAKMVFISSPIIVVGKKPINSDPLALYPDPVNYSKARNSPPANCYPTSGSTSACSMYELVLKTYGTVGAANTAWGTSYTTLGSSGKNIGWTLPYPNTGGSAAAESFGTGDGTTLTFNHTLANTTVSAFSIGIFVSGTLVAGDCPNYKFTACTTAPAGGGNLIGPNIASGNCIYATGVCTITFTNGNAPANAAAITAQYVQNGYCVGTGLMDECGGNTASNGNQVGTNDLCVLKIASTYISNHAYTAGDEFEDTTSGTWQIVMTTGTSQNSRPSFAVDNNFSTQGVKLTDSNGIVYESLGPGVCSSEPHADHAAPDMGQAIAGFLETPGGYESNQVLAYYQAIGDTAWRNQFPDNLYGGTDETSYNAPARPALLTVANIKLDWMFTSAMYAPSIDLNWDAKYMFLTRYYQGPIIAGQFFFSNSQGQSSNGQAPNTKPTFSTLQAMAQAWFSLENSLVNLCGGFNNQCQFQGIDWGASHSFAACNSCGLKDTLDNAYSGCGENCVASVACDPPNGSLTCGGEAPGSAWNNIDAIGTGSNGLIRNAGCLWYGCGAAPAQSVTAPVFLIAKREHKQ